VQLDKQDVSSLTKPVIAYALNQIVAMTDVIEERCELLNDLDALIEGKPAVSAVSKQHSARLKQVKREIDSQIDLIVEPIAKQFHRGQRAMRREIDKQLRSFIRTQLVVESAKATSDKWKMLGPLTSPKIAVAVGIGVSAVLIAAKFLKAGQDPSHALAEGKKLAKQQEEADKQIKEAQDAIKKADELNKANEERLKKYKEQYPDLS
jgi:hypothetical protein